MSYSKPFFVLNARVETISYLEENLPSTTFNYYLKECLNEKTLPTF